MKTITITMSDDLQQKLFDFLTSEVFVMGVGEIADYPVVLKYPFGKNRHHIDIEKITSA